jgi:DNA-binding MltR family transcriptional regulator
MVKSVHRSLELKEKLNQNQKLFQSLMTTLKMTLKAINQIQLLRSDNVSVRQFQSSLKVILFKMLK